MGMTTLPNGIELETPNSKEAAFVYSEIFERHCYLKHGLTLDDGATVFDVGANVGVFSVFLAQRYRDLRLVLFEPVPDTFAFLEDNARRLMRDANVTLVPAGVFSTAGHATFEVDSGWSVDAGTKEALREIEASSRRARKQAGRLTWSRAAIDDAEHTNVLSATAAHRLRRALDDWWARPLVYAALWAVFKAISLRRRLKRRSVECELTTLSAALRNHDIDTVDLVKVDVEGAEWAVLQGIDDADWPRLRQFAMEVHDVDGRVERTRHLLESKGYDVVVESSDMATVELLGIKMVYAKR
jgi:FkbM family methyltransferase